MSEMSEFNWSEHIARVQNERVQAKIGREESQRQQEEERAAVQQILHRMDAVVRSFLWAAGTQGWPGVEHEFETVVTSQRFWRYAAEQSYVGAGYTSSGFNRRNPTYGYPVTGIHVNVNGNWDWCERSNLYDERGSYLGCANRDGVLENTSRARDITLSLEDTPQKVMSVLAQIAVDNAIIL